MTRGWMIQGFAAAAVMCGVAPAMADDFGFAFGYHGHHHHKAVNVGVVVGRPAPVVVRPAPVIVRPAPIIVQPVRRVWVPPVYNTVTERVWVPTTTTAFRDVPVVDVWGRVVGYRREAYAVPSGYWSHVTRQVLVHEGCWTTTVGPAPCAPNYEEGQPGPDHDDHGDYGQDEHQGNGDAYRGDARGSRSTAGPNPGKAGTRISAIR